MRTIHKQGSGGYHLDRADQTQPTSTQQAESRWSGFGYKDEVISYLDSEQYGLCAYSEIRPDEYGLGTHIEHLEPKSQNPRRTFDYNNLVLSALSTDDLQKIVHNDIFGGHAKLNNYDVHLFVSCLQANCASYFAYLSNGLLEPSHHLNADGHRKAQYTIKVLNLNSPYLITQRKIWLDELDHLIDEHIDKNMSLQDLAAIDLIPTNNKLSQFFTATRQRFGKVAEKLLEQHSPELV